MHRPCCLLQPQLTSDTDALLQLFEHTKAWQGSPIGAEVVTVVSVGTEPANVVGTMVGSTVVGTCVAAAVLVLAAGVVVPRGLRRQHVSAQYLPQVEESV